MLSAVKSTHLSLQLAFSFHTWSGTRRRSVLCTTSTRQTVSSTEPHWVSHTYTHTQQVKMQQCVTRVRPEPELRWSGVCAWTISFVLGRFITVMAHVCDIYRWSPLYLYVVTRGHKSRVGVCCLPVVPPQLFSFVLLLGLCKKCIIL